MGLPPSLLGAVQLTVADASPATAVTPLGDPGAVTVCASAGSLPATAASSAPAATSPPKACHRLDGRYNWPIMARSPLLPECRRTLAPALPDHKAVTLAGSGSIDSGARRGVNPGDRAPSINSCHAAGRWSAP